MFYYNDFWGMNLIWWAIWGMLLFWIFALPYDIPGQRNRRDSTFDILQKQFALGQITKDEYQEKKRLLKSNLSK